MITSLMDVAWLGAGLITTGVGLRVAAAAAARRARRADAAQVVRQLRAADPAAAPGPEVLTAWAEGCARLYHAAHSASAPADPAAAERRRCQ